MAVCCLLSHSTMLGDSSKRRKDVLLSNIILRKNLINRFQSKRLYFWMVYFRNNKARIYAQCSWISKWGQQKWRFCLFSAEAGNDDTKGNNSKKKVLIWNCLKKMWILAPFLHHWQHQLLFKIQMLMGDNYLLCHTLISRALHMPAFFSLFLALLCSGFKISFICERTTVSQTKSMVVS